MLDRLSGDEGKVPGWDGDPRDDRRPCGLPARTAVAQGGVSGLSLGAIADRAAKDIPLLQVPISFYKIAIASAPASLRSLNGLALRRAFRRRLSGVVGSITLFGDHQDD